MISRHSIIASVPGLPRSARVLIKRMRKHASDESSRDRESRISGSISIISRQYLARAPWSTRVYAMQAWHVILIDIRLF